MDVYPRFLRALTESIGIEPGSTIRVAVSGGADSVALASLFVRASRSMPLGLSLGHVHHGLRGIDADRDLEHCRRLAEDFDVPFHSRSVDTAAYARTHGVSEETAARQLRLETFAAWGRDEQLFGIATAHHADDQVESILAHMIRGCGLRGLQGMSPSRPLRDGLSHGANPEGPITHLLRPLLGVTRAELDHYREATGLEYRTDESNASLRHTRNRIRHQLLPLLEEFNPNVRRALLGLSQDAIRARATQLDFDGIQAGPEIASFDARNLPAARRSGELLDQLWLAHHSAPLELNRNQRDRLVQFLGGGDGHRYDLPRGWRLERVGSWIHLFRLTAVDHESPAPVTTRLDQGVELAPWNVRVAVVSVAAYTPPARHDARSLWVPLARGGEVGVWRGPHVGEKIRTENGHAAIGELLRAAGVPSTLRPRYPILEVEGDVWWIPGVRVSAAAPRPIGVDSEADPRKNLGQGVVLELVAPIDASPEAFVISVVVAQRRG